MHTMSEEQARAIAQRAHAGIEDRHGIPYLRHVEGVAAASLPFAKVLAWLHDVVEDTDWTVEQLRAEGLSDEDCQAVALISRDKSTGETYMQWIRRIADTDGPVGRKVRHVKLADVRHNRSRPTPPDMAGIDRRYLRAERILRDAIAARAEQLPLNA